jgi:methyltransferase, FkbM family
MASVGMNVIQKLFTRINPAVVVDGHKMFLDDKDSMNLRVNGIFEPQETELVKQEVKRGDVVLDLGANIGYHTLLFARLVGSEGKVYAFEPDPTNFALLKRNVRANGYTNVELVQKAVSDKNGKIKLYLCEENRGDHRIYDSHDGRESVEVESVRLDDYFQGYEREINFIKMDIQGAEMMALRGMRSLLLQQPSMKLLSEFWPVGFARSGGNALEYFRLLEECHFTVYDLKHPEESTSAEELLAKYSPASEDFTNLWCVRV